MERRKIRVGITHGDINGVGYEVILKTFSNPEMLSLCTPIVYGSAKVATYHRKALALPNMTFTSINSAEEADPDKLNILNCIDDDVKVELSVPSQEAGKAALDALQRVVKDYEEGLIDVIVTAPINKNTIQSDDFRFAGHTEFFEEKLGEGNKSLMILVKDNLRMALATNHLPISEISSNLTKEVLAEKIRLFNSSLKNDFGIDAPKIAILALNPHAGDGGLIGKEEIEVIKPVIEDMKQEKILCFGPFPADGFMGAGSFKHFDGVLAMYHDQGLAPFKLLAMESGVNFTAGLPVVRTSPAHGTAYDITGKGIASEDSFREAVYMAMDIYRFRLSEKAAKANPLRKQYYEKKDDSDKLKLDQVNDDEDTLPME